MHPVATHAQLSSLNLEDDMGKMSDIVDAVLSHDRASFLTGDNQHLDVVQRVCSLEVNNHVDHRHHSTHPRGHDVATLHDHCGVNRETGNATEKL